MALMLCRWEFYLWIFLSTHCLDWVLRRKQFLLEPSEVKHKSKLSWRKFVGDIEGRKTNGSKSSHIK